MTSFLRLYETTKDCWTGCDWPTRFGHAELNLAGITARQAALLARATSGQESIDWQQAAHWLATVEADADAARHAAASAQHDADAGRFQDALRHAELAVQLETPYHQPALWQTLRNAILGQLSDTAAAE